MDHEPLLRDLGSRVTDAFDRALSVDIVPERLSRFALHSEAERFQLWAHNLGLHQDGHASLDYRVRDSEFVRDRLVEFIEELAGHVENLAAIIVGDRKPAEDIDDPTDQHDCSTSSSSSDSDSNICTESPSVADSLHEVDIRLQSITDSLDDLYKLATKIRNPKNRPSRTVQQLFKNSTTDDLEGYIRQREEVEANIISPFCREYIYQNIDTGTTGGSSEEELTNIVSQYADPSHWLISRAGKANARRKQQFIHWKEHATKLSRKHVAPKIPVAGPAVPKTKVLLPRAATAEAVTPSLATSATKLPALKIDDLKSEISHQSRISSIVRSRDSGINWPAPPKAGKKDKYFECPYCRVLCPVNYLRKGKWEDHLIHDLGAYSCTYEHCTDPHRLYGSKQEWIDHESQHTRVWYCADHDVEFETAPEYISHMTITHPGCNAETLSSELVASVVGPSMHVHRDCPFCPTPFESVLKMQNHIAQHLERLALLALPLAEGSTEHGSAAAKSSDSHSGQMRGRADSLVEDFGLRFGLQPIPFRSLDLGRGSFDAYATTDWDRKVIFYNANDARLVYCMEASAEVYVMTYDIEDIALIQLDESGEDPFIRVVMRRVRYLGYLKEHPQKRFPVFTSLHPPNAQTHRISVPKIIELDSIKSLVASISWLAKSMTNVKRNAAKGPKYWSIWLEQDQSLNVGIMSDYITDWLEGIEDGCDQTPEHDGTDKIETNHLLLHCTTEIFWLKDEDRYLAEMYEMYGKERTSDVLRGDSDCAICHAPASHDCDCEVKQCEERIDETET